MVSVNYSKIPVAALGSLTKRIAAKVGESDIKDLTDSDEFKKLKEDVDIFQLAINKRKYTEYTAKVEDADKRRDEDSIALREYVQTMQKSRNTEMAEAAKKVNFILENFGSGIERLPYDAESSKLNGIITELRKDSNKELISKINLEHWLDSLQKSQEEFEALVSVRIDDKTAIQEVRSASTLRADLIASLKSFFDLLNLNIRVRKTENYITLGNIIQNIIDEVAKNYNKGTSIEEKRIEEK